MDKYKCIFQILLIYVLLLINILCKENILNIWKKSFLQIYNNLDKYQDLSGLLLDKEKNIKYISFKEKEEYKIFSLNDKITYNLTNFNFLNREIIINNISFLCGQSKYIYYKLPNISNQNLSYIQISDNEFIDNICFKNNSNLIIFNPGNEGITILNINNNNTIQKNKINMNYLLYYFIVSDNESYYMLVKDKYDYIIVNLSYSENNNFIINYEFRLSQNFFLFSKIKVSYYKELLFIFTYEENTSSFLTYKIDLKRQNIIINDILTTNGLFLGTKFLNISFIPKTQFIYYSIKKDNINYLGLFDIESNILIFNIKVDSNMLFYSPYAEEEILYSILYINNSILYEICPFNEINNNSKKCEFDFEKKFLISSENGNKNINECNNSYILNNYCIENCPIGTEVKNNTCQNKCENNMKLNLITNECVIECDDDDLLINNFCTSYIKNNIFLSQNSLFSIENCEDAFHKPYNEKNKCLSKCKLGSYYNEIQKTCINCKEQGKYLNEELNECTEECPNNIYDENNICYNCKDRGLFSYKNISNNNKIECLLSCSENYLVLNSSINECFKCPEGEYYETNPNNINYTKCSPKCSLFYTNISGICEKCTDYSDGNNTCIDYNNDLKYCNMGSEIETEKKICKNCLLGGEKYINGSCYRECDDYTIKDENNICLNCINNETHQYFYNSTCIQKCSNESQQTGYICEDCAELNLTYFSGSCVETCPNYTLKIDNKCKLCEDVYKDKPFYSNNTDDNCTNQCGYLEAIINETNRKECILCNKIYENKCVDICPYNSIDKNNSCEKCTDVNYPYLYNGKCIEKCLEGTRSDEGYCERCNKTYHKNSCDRKEDESNTYVFYLYEDEVEILKTCYCNQKFKGGNCTKEDNMTRIDYTCKCKENFKGNNCHINYYSNNSEFYIDVYTKYPPSITQSVMFKSYYTGNEIIESYKWESSNVFCFESTSETNQNCEINGNQDNVYILDKNFFNQIPCNYSIKCEITLKNGKKLSDTIYINPSSGNIDSPTINFFYQNKEEKDKEEEEKKEEKEEEKEKEEKENKDKEKYEKNYKLKNKFINLKYKYNQNEKDEIYNEDDNDYYYNNYDSDTKIEDNNYCPMQSEISMSIYIEYINSTENYLYQLYYSMKPDSTDYLFEFSKKFFQVDAPKMFYFPGNQIYLKTISRNGNYQQEEPKEFYKGATKSYCNTLKDIKNDGSIFNKTGKMLSLFDYYERENYNLNLTTDDLDYIEDFILTNFNNSLKKETLNESVYQANEYDNYYLPGDELFELHANSYQLLLRHMVKYLFYKQNTLFKDGLKILSKSIELLSNYKLDSQNKMYPYMLNTYKKLFDIILNSNKIKDNNFFNIIYSDIQKITGIISKSMSNGEIYQIKDDEKNNIIIYRFGRSHKTISIFSNHIYYRHDNCGNNSGIILCIEKNEFSKIINEINQFEGINQTNVGLSLISYEFTKEYISKFLNETMMSLFNEGKIKLISNNISHLNFFSNQSFNAYQIKKNYFYTINFGNINDKNKTNIVCVPIEYLGKNDKNNICKTYFALNERNYKILCECNTFTQIAVIENEYYANFYKDLQFNNNNKIMLSNIIIACTICSIAFFSIILLSFDINDEKKIEEINNLDIYQKMKYYYNKVSYLNNSNILSFSLELFHIYFPFSNIFNIYSPKISRHLRFIIEIIKILITLIISLYFSFYDKKFTEIIIYINERNFIKKNITKNNFETNKKEQILIVITTLFFYFLVSILFDFICSKCGYNEINKNKFKPIQNIISRFIYYKVKPFTLFNEKGKKVRTRIIALSKIYGTSLIDSKNKDKIPDLEKSKIEIMNDKSFESIQNSFNISSMQMSFVLNDINNNNNKIELTTKKMIKNHDIYLRYIKILKNKKQNNNIENENDIFEIIQKIEENHIVNPNIKSLIINIISNISFIVIIYYILVLLKKMIDKVYDEFENYLIYSWLIPSFISLFIYNFVINYIICIIISLIFFKSYYRTSSKIKKFIYKYKYFYKIMVLITNNKNDIDPVIDTSQLQNILNNQ